MTDIPPNSLIASEAFVVPLEDPSDPSADEWARLDGANADEDARAEGYKDGFRAGLARALRNKATVKAEALEEGARLIEANYSPIRGDEGPSAEDEVYNQAATILRDRATALRAGTS